MPSRKRPRAQRPPNTQAHFGMTDRQSETIDAHSIALLRRLGLMTTLAVLVLITVGGVVRASGSGLGCPDWPTCHGQLVPPLVIHPILEYTHRFVAGIVSVLVVLFTAYAWLRHRHRTWILFPVTAATGLLLIEITLGALTVEHDLTPVLVTTHLATALALYACVTVGTLAAYLVYTPDRQLYIDRYAQLIIGTALATYILMLVGSLVTMSSAAYACSGWPLCGSGFQLPAGEPENLNVLHRLVAGLVVIGVIAMVAWLGSSRPTDYALKRHVWAGLILLILQVLVGMGLVLWGIPPFTAVLHLAVAAAFFGNLVAVAVLACFAPTSLTKQDDRRSQGAPARALV